MCYLNVYVDSNDQKLNEENLSKPVTKIIIYHTWFSPFFTSSSSFSLSVTEVAKHGKHVYLALVSAGALTTYPLLSSAEFKTSLKILMKSF